jgi:hypothetical protein
MTLYQPTIIYNKHSLFFGLWKIKMILSSTLVFDDYQEAEKYWSAFTSGLIRRGIKLKNSNHIRHIAHLHITDK